MRILLVEDDKKLAGYLKKGLMEEQYAVDVFHDGIDGVYWAKELDDDLIILDVMLPGKDGIGVHVLCDRSAQDVAIHTCSHNPFRPYLM